MAVYLDASALVKLAVAERESVALDAYLRAQSDRWSCILSRTEVPRAVRRHRADFASRALAILEHTLLLELTDEILDRAALIEPPRVRNLDAIHIAAALTLENELEAMVTYDTHVAEAAEAAGLRVDAPA